MNYRLAKSVELIERNGEPFLMSKNPLCVLRLNRSLAELVERGRSGNLITAAATEVAVLEQLTARGFAERVRGASQPLPSHPNVSIVIPVMNRAEELRRCLTSLKQLAFPQEKLQVIVVDDGSSDDSPTVAQEFGALLVTSGGVGRGPAAARNVGASKANGELLAFIDSDCCASTNWLNDLIPAFNDPDMAAVGGQVDGMCSESAVDRYESVMSSLSLGSRERRGSTGNDTFYLPSCNLLVCTTAFRQAGGFDDSMHVGEDVDLTWRLRDRGWTICYLPVGNVQHEHRSSIRSFMSRRFDYGTSEGMLQLLHPLRRKQMVIPPLLALVLALSCVAPFCSGWSFAAAIGILVTDIAIVRFSFVRRNLPVSLAMLTGGRLRALGSLAYYLSFHLVRYYAIPLFAVALLVPGLWFSLLPLLAFLSAAGVDYAIRKPPLTFIFFSGIYLLEQVAYGSGVFWGCVRRKCFASYRIAVLKTMEAAA